MAPRKTPQKKYSCKFPRCTNSYIWSRLPEHKVQNKRYYRFPKDHEMINRWKTVCGLSQSVAVKHKFVCEDHFQDCDFINISKRILFHHAIPRDVTNQENLIPVVAHEPLETDETCDHNYCVPATANNDKTCEKTMTNDTRVIQEQEINENQLDMNNNIVEPSVEPSTPPKKTGFLRRIGLAKKNLTPTKSEMYKIHRATCSTLSRMKKQLDKKDNQLREVQKLYESNTFQKLEMDLNTVTKEFINSQLRNVGRGPQGKRWTTQDKCFALSLYKRSPRLYKYLQEYFELPSSRTLKAVLSKLEFEPGINQSLIALLRTKAGAMEENDKCCSLIFDEMSLSRGFHYQPHKEKIVGFEDLGELGRTSKEANHVLLFMLRGLKQSWKQVIAYYFVANTISSDKLKTLIKLLITQLQDCGFNIMSTICDQGSTQRKALSDLSKETSDNFTNYTFEINGRTVVIIYDVPHLLKCTRNAMLRCNILYNENKLANFEHIKATFDFDQQRQFKLLPHLHAKDFNFKDGYIKMKVRVAAAQLSHSVAAAVETNYIEGRLPANAIDTAVFASDMNNLFDSLNGYQQYPVRGKMYYQALRHDTPHWELWERLLPQIGRWKMIERQSGKSHIYVFHI